MVKTIFILLFLVTFSSANSFEKNCLECHANDFQLYMFMKKYSLKYSSERLIKESIFEYLKNPTFKASVLPFGYLNRFGIKDKTQLADEELKKMIDIYYKQYNIKSRIY